MIIPFISFIHAVKVLKKYYRHAVKFFNATKTHLIYLTDFRYIFSISLYHGLFRGRVGGQQSIICCVT